MTPPAASLTAEQRAAVEDRAGPLLLSANAGSGKTTVLVERIVAAVREDGVDLPAILAITFTDKAAAELRSRVRARFAELGDHVNAREAERASISTIHGFCAALLRSHPVAAGIDPRFAVIDEERADRLADRAYEDALGAVLDAGGDAALDGLSPYRAEDLRAVVRFAHDSLRVRGQAEPELPDPPPLPDPVAARAALAAACADLAAELERPDAPETALAAAEVVGECSAFLAGLEDRVPVRLELAGFDVKGNGQGLRCEAAQAYRDALARYRRACWEPQAARTYAWLRELVREHARRYAALKREHAALDFADLELRAHALLASDPGLRGRVARRYAHVMVDEFQDTNPLQLAILDLIAPDNLFAVGDEFQSIYGFRHADVGLFRALRARREAEGRARALRRNFRSRAEIVDAIDLAFSGRLFGEGFVPLEPNDAAPRGTAPPVELMVCAKKGWDHADLGETLPAATAWRLAEARALADRVRALVDGGREPGEIVLLFRASTDMAVFERALEDRGIPTYLVGGRGFWSQRQVSDVAAYLAALANPRDDLRLYEVLASPMVGASSDALALIARAAHAARAPAFEVLSAALDPAAPRAGEAAIAPGQQGTLFEGDPAPAADGVLAADLPAADRERLTGFAARFAAHRAVAPRLALDALIDRVVRDTGYDVAVLRLPGGERRLANVRKLMRLAREHEAAEGRDLRALVDRVHALAARAADREAEAPVESESALAGSGLGAVRLMTIHRAKGLEFPVVCLADLGREPPSGARDHLRLCDDGAVGLRVPSPEGSLPAFAWEAIGEEADRAATEEERRLAYVAMTRAQEHLILSGAADLIAWGNGKGREPLVWLADALVPDLLERLGPDSPDVEVQRAESPWSARVRCRYVAPETADPAMLAPAPAAAERPGEGMLPGEEAAPRLLPLPPSPASAPLARLSYSALESYARCPYRFYLERVLGLPPELPGPTTREPGAGLPANVRGTLAHALLERAPSAVPTPDEVTALAAAHGVELTAAEIEDLRALVGGFLAGPLAARVAAASDVRREAGFAFALSHEHAHEHGAPVLTGAVDLIATEPDGAALVVDYKTDRLGDADPAEVVGRAYRAQRLIYALAALREGAPAVEVVHCFLERAEEPVAARYETAEIPALEAELSALAAGVLAKRFPPTDTPHRDLCMTCPGRAALCSWPEDVTARPLEEAIA